MRANLSRSALAFAAVITLAASACSSDQIVGPSSERVPPSTSDDNFFTAHGAFQRYVAIGTSISAGVQSDGLLALTQLTSWPAQLAGMAGVALKQPYISGTGCRAPIVAPLLLGVRLSGESALTPDALLGCAPLLPGVTLPVDNVSINGALASDALNTTPAIAALSDPANAKIYSRVLQSGMTQVSTMMARNPSIVSVELGSNEILGAISGIVLPPVVTPFATWMSSYDKVLDSVQKVTKRAVVVGLINDLSHVQAFRSGNDLWGDRAEFALFNVAVSNDCNGSPNLVFVPLLVPTTVLNGLAQAKNGGGPVPLSCADGSPVAADFILSPPETLAVNTQMRLMTAHIQSEAAARGFAYFPLGALYDAKSAKPPFSVLALMTLPTPFGAYFSLDGVHPNAAGQAILARAAAQALNTTYGLGIP